jgi:hypothetical protein
MSCRFPLTESDGSGGDEHRSSRGTGVWARADAQFSQGIRVNSDLCDRGYVQTAFSKVSARIRPVSRAESPRPV